MAIRIEEDSPVGGTELKALKRAIKDMYRASNRSDASVENLYKLFKKVMSAFELLLTKYEFLEATVGPQLDTFLATLEAAEKKKPRQ